MGIVTREMASETETAMKVLQRTCPSGVMAEVEGKREDGTFPTRSVMAVEHHNLSCCSHLYNESWLCFSSFVHQE